MKLLITGSTGLIGSHLVPRLIKEGHTLIRLMRNPGNSPDTIYWQPSEKLDSYALVDLDAVIHLAGETITGRWTSAKKRRIRQSRVDFTRALVSELMTLPHPPSTIISASAIGFYGHRGDALLNEISGAGSGFLADLCHDWEAAVTSRVPDSTRTVQMRIGIVLSTQGGALKEMLTPFNMGVGGVMGTGQQYMSWIALDDLVNAILFVLNTASITGPVNAVAPHPVTNREFVKTLGHVLQRPTFTKIPGFMIKTLFGEMGDALLLSSTRVLPTVLQHHGFVFNYETLQSALTHLLKI